MERAMTDYLPGYDAWKTTNPDDEYDHDQYDHEDEEEFEEPVIDEEWNASRGEYETTVTFASGKKFAVRQVPHWDTWEVNGPDFYMDFQTLEQALDYLTDDEFVRTA
jgi:hypothetical protein